jgi:hypothetical protein
VKSGPGYADSGIEPGKSPAEQAGVDWMPWTEGDFGHNSPLCLPLHIQLLKERWDRASCEDTPVAKFVDFRLFRAFRLRFGCLALRFQG